MSRYTILIFLPAITLILPILIASIDNGSIIELFKDGCVLIIISCINFMLEVKAFIMKDIERFIELVYDNIFGLLRLMVYIHILSILLSKSNVIEKVTALYYNNNTIMKRCTAYVGNIKFLHKLQFDQMQSAIVPIYSSNKNLLLQINRCVANIVKFVKGIFDNGDGDDKNPVLKQILYSCSSNYHNTNNNDDDSRCYICKEPSPKIHTICCSIAVHVECMNECLKSTKSSCLVCTSVLRLKYDGDRGCHAT